MVKSRSRCDLLFFVGNFIVNTRNRKKQKLEKMEKK